MSRSDDIQAELRASAPAAPDALRTRVQAITTRESVHRRPAFTRRRMSLVLVGGLALAAVGAAAVQGLDSGTGGKKSAASLANAQASQTTAVYGAVIKRAAPAHGSSATVPSATLQAGASAAGIAKDAATAEKPQALRALAPSQLPPAGFRLQNYDVQLGIRVRNAAALSHATVQAMRWTRANGGFVASVSYDTPGRSRGSSELVLRVPVGRVQAALQQFSSLGTLTSQHVSIQDLQGTVNAQTKRIITLNRRIGAILTTLQTTQTVEKTAQLQAELAARRQELAAITVAKAATVRQGRLAHIYLELRSQAKKHAVVPAKPHEPGAIGGKLHSAGHVLAQELAFVLAALVILAPFILLGALGFAGARALRRRSDRRLLDATPS